MCSHLTGGWGGAEVNLLAVLSKPGLVAASHPQHIDAVYLQPLHHGAGPLHIVQPLPGRCGVGGPGAPPRGRGSPRSPLVFDGKTPSPGRVLRQPPAQEELVVSERLLSVYHGGERRCGTRSDTIRLRIFTHFYLGGGSREQKDLPHMNSKPWIS